MRTDAAACPARRGQAQGLRPWEPRQRRCLYTPQGTSRAGRGEPPLDPAARFLRRLAAEENAWRDSEGWGGFSVAQRKVFFHFISERTPCAPPPHQSKVLGRWEVGVRGRREESPSSEGFPPSSPGTSRLPLSGCPALAPFGDDSPLFLAERQELVGQQRIGEGKVGTLMHTA